MDIPWYNQQDDFWDVFFYGVLAPSHGHLNGDDSMMIVQRIFRGIPLFSDKPDWIYPLVN